MAAEIQLPDGTPAIYDGKWHCSDPKAIPMLEYFTGEVLKEEYDTTAFPNRHASIAELVAAKIIGAKLVRYDPVKSRPGAIY